MAGLSKQPANDFNGLVPGSGPSPISAKKSAPSLSIGRRGADDDRVDHTPPTTPPTASAIAAVLAGETQEGRPSAPLPPLAPSIVVAPMPSPGGTASEAVFLSEVQQKRQKLEQYRTVCSEVVDGFLYVSGQDVAGDPAALTACGITHVINCAGPHCPNFFEDRSGDAGGAAEGADVVTNSSSRNGTGDGSRSTARSGAKGGESGGSEGSFAYLKLDMYDHRSEDISWFIYPAFDFISMAAASGSYSASGDGGGGSNGKRRGRVLIHCVQGVSRSCALAIAWVMLSAGASYEKAYDHVRARRGVCAPNTAFVCGLLEWQKRRRSLGSGGGGNIAAALQPQRALQPQSPPTPAQPGQVLFYRTAWHVPFFPGDLLLKLCIREEDRTPVVPGPDALDSRACFVIIVAVDAAAAAAAAGVPSASAIAQKDESAAAEAPPEDEVRGAEAACASGGNRGGGGGSSGGSKGCISSGGSSSNGSGSGGSGGAGTVGHRRLVFVWCGRESHPAMRELALRGVQWMAAYEGCEAAPAPHGVVLQGEETAAFWNAIGAAPPAPAATASGRDGNGGGNGGGGDDGGGGGGDGGRSSSGAGSSKSGCVSASAAAAAPAAAAAAAAAAVGHMAAYRDLEQEGVSRQAPPHFSRELEATRGLLLAGSAGAPDGQKIDVGLAAAGAAAGGEKRLPQEELAPGPTRPPLGTKPLAAGAATGTGAEALAPMESAAEEENEKVLLFECIAGGAPGDSLSSSLQNANTASAASALAAGFSWSRLAVYDDQDLQPESCLLLIAPGRQFFVWVGDAFHVGQVCQSGGGGGGGGDGCGNEDVDGRYVAGDVGGALSSFRRFLAAVAHEKAHAAALGAMDFAALQIVVAGAETDTFWSAFESGY